MNQAGEQPAAAVARVTEEEDISQESGYGASAGTPGPASFSSDASSFRRKTSRQHHHHQVRIIDNRLKKPASSETDPPQARRRHHNLPHRFTRSCTSNDDDDDDDEYDKMFENVPGPSSSVPLPPAAVDSATQQPLPTSSILVINPSATPNGAQKHVTLLTGSTEPSPTSIRTPCEERETTPSVQIPNTSVANTAILPQLSPTNVDQSPIEPPSFLATERRRLSGATPSSSSLKRTSSVHSGPGENTPPTPVKSTLKNPSSTAATKWRRQRASLPAMQTRLLLSSSPAASRLAVSSDEIEEIEMGQRGRREAGVYSRNSTQVEPICVVNLASPAK